MIIFENPGQLDMRAVKTMGISAKDKERSTIGFFGTGLKYALAVLLRTGHEVYLQDGHGNQHVFGMRSITVRDEQFFVVTLNDEELGFTTDLGKTWEVWQAYRELYCNALDEGGEVHTTPGTYEAEEGKVMVLVKGVQIEEVHRNRDRYILDTKKRKLILESEHCDIYWRQTPMDQMPRATFFYRGIRVGVSPQLAEYDYNIKDTVDLTEDRTMKYSHQVHQAIAHAVTTCEDEEMIKKFTLSPDNIFEHDIGYGYTYERPSEVWLDLVGEIRKERKDTGLPYQLINLHKKFRKNVAVLPTESIKLNNIDYQRLERAKDFCTQYLDLDMDEFEMIICEDLGHVNHLGRADIDNGKMYLSKSLFDKGTKYLLMGLIEEHTHVKRRVYDETLEQKQIYLEMITNLTEKLAGEPI